MLQDLLWLILSAVVVRAVWRVIDGVMEGMTGQSRRAPQKPQGGVPVQGVQMVRDPVCGTYIVPSRAVVMADGPQQLFFCSVTCRDKYRASRSGRTA